MRALRVALVAATAGMLVGCGGNQIAGRAVGGLMISDAGSGVHYELGVADGALTLTGTPGAGAASDPGLTDGTTGAGYTLRVANGALTLAPGGAGAQQIGLVDSVTAKTYELSVEGGALTLIAPEGGR